MFICTANLCRSPMAQAVAAHMARLAGLAPQFQFDSAGTHAGRARAVIDPRAAAILAGRGYAAVRQRVRQFDAQDFGRYDLLLVMEQAQLSYLQSLCPPEHAHKVQRFLDYAQDVKVREVPDPYFGNAEGFARVLDLCEAGAHGVLEHYRTTRP